MNNREQAYSFMDQASIAASSNSRIKFQVDSTWDFVATHFTYHAIAAGVPTFDIMLESNDDKLFQNPLSSVMLCGCLEDTATPAFTFPGVSQWEKFVKPYFFPANSLINVTITNTSGLTNLVRIAIKGYKIKK